MQHGRKVCIIAGKRIPFMRSSTRYLGLSLRELIKPAMDSLIYDLKLEGRELGECAFGAVNKHAYDFALAREIVMDSKLSAHTPATDLQKACGTSLEAAVMIGNKIALGQIECGIAGGVDTNSDVPIEFKKSFSDRLLKIAASKTLPEKLQALKGFNPKELLPKLPAIKEGRAGMSMGESCEEMAKSWNISREAQDKLAFESQTKAAKAYAEGWYDDSVVEFKGKKKDGILRETSLEKLSSLKPAFDKKSGKGTLTAGNSTALTDGASCVFLCSEEYAKEHNLEPMAYLTYAQSAAVDYVNDEGLLMAPAYAVPRMLKRADLTLQDFDFYEIHEAFAAQVLCTLEAWKSAKFCKDRLGLDSPLGEIDFEKLNVKGGSLALGHPFAATGGRIITGLAKLLQEKGSGRGLISICTAGGMGVTAIIER
ncbi:MAG: acetyl-CoA C-acyltransferase [Halobacteriovoraceae bacterium]|nr:acetyl-CoA C-acyltransferase [Halobacteriovoraceae bacterium]|tara:strand:- start:8387 stop:9661 length:1275 start_codon:yes stop_codon:yes gene_type:complete